MSKLLALPLGGVIIGLSLLLPGVALAHEQRDVGKYHLVVGFLNEPAIQNQMNGIDLTITTTADKKPVEGAEKTLKAVVIVGGNAKSMPITLRARFGLPGKYAGDFMPTAAGAYQFHFTGAINGDAIDQRFESGPGTFGDVKPIQPLQFPDKLASPAELQSQLADAQSAANSARVLAIVGLLAGVAGVAVGVAGLMRRGGSAEAARRPSSPGQKA
ncbi:MAG: hypothetical protein KGJ86_13475 [Chloroflexota bacterium]|nr:hypothetical protein [Chloroflexota bacterium]